MNINNIAIYSTIIILIILITGPTIHKVNLNHENALYEVTNKKIIEASIICKNKYICKNDIITLKDLYDNNLLTQIVDPITKQIYSETSYVAIKNGIYTFNIK